MQNRQETAHVIRFLSSKSYRIPQALLLGFSLCLSSAWGQELKTNFDVVVYGGTSAGVAAAVQVKQMGKSVVVVSPDMHLGGLTAGGLGWTDSGDKDAIGGISRQFYHRVWKHYEEDSAWRWQDKAEFGGRNQSPPGKDGDGSTKWVFEPSVAEKLFEDLVQENKIVVHRDQWLDRGPGGVVVEAGRIQAIRTLSGQVFRGKMFIDATYEGDLMAAAGVSYHVGREANSVYDEQWNGIQTGVLHHSHFFAKPVDPYVVAGDPSSGLLPQISSNDPGKKGDGDDRIQAYCFRMCLTNVPDNRIEFAKPDGYDRANYELLTRVFASGWRQMFHKFDPLPNAKTDTNNHGPFSTDYIGMNYGYPEGSYAERQEIIRRHEVYQQGLMYFMANDPSVPADVRDQVSQWGLAADEFTDNGGWPHQIYVREARRMVGNYVMTEHDCLDRRPTPESVGMGSYTLDSHNVQRYVTPDGTVQNEGDIGVKTPRPYEIAYGAIIPRKDECENLLVPICVSSSHIAFGSIRMEPVFMILGQSAATAACLSIDADVAVQDLPYPKLREQLLQDKQVLELEVVYENASNLMPGTVLDDQLATRVGSWQLSSANRPFVDAGYLHNGNSEPGEKRLVFETSLEANTFEVGLSWPAHNNRASKVKLQIHHRDGMTEVEVNQKQKPSADGFFRSLGAFPFDGPARVELLTDGADGYVVADAVRFLRVDTPGL